MPFMAIENQHTYTKISLHFKVICKNSLRVRVHFEVLLFPPNSQSERNKPYHLLEAYF